MRIFILLVSLLLSGCTSMLWQSTKANLVAVNGIYVSESRGELLVSSTKDGYIFKIEPNTAQVLLLRQSIVFMPVFEKFKVDRKNRVTGQLTLLVDHTKLNEAQHQKLNELGFTDYSTGNRTRLEIPLDGRRYQIEGELPFEKLRETYTLKMARPDTFIETVTKIVATPLTITIDAVIVLPATFLSATIMAAAASGTNN